LKKGSMPLKWPDEVGILSHAGSNPRSRIRQATKRLGSPRFQRNQARLGRQGGRVFTFPTGTAVRKRKLGLLTFGANAKEGREVRGTISDKRRGSDFLC